MQFSSIGHPSSLAALQQWNPSQQVASPVSLGDTAARLEQLLNRFEQFVSQQAHAPMAMNTPVSADSSLANDLQQQMLRAQLGGPGGFFQPTAKAETPLANGNWLNALPNLGISTSSGAYNANNFERQRNTKQADRHYGNHGQKTDTSKKNNPIGPGTYGIGNTLLGGEAYLAEFGGINESVGGDWGKVNVQGQTRLMEARGRVYNYTGFDPRQKTLGLGLGAQAQLNLIRSQYGASYETPSVNIAGRDISLKTTASAEAFVGAQGDAEATIVLGKEPRLRVGAGGFAGASASVSGGVEAAGLGVNGSATGWAGAGAKADLTLGFDKGKLKFGFDVGAALGVGGQLSWGISIDPKEVAGNVLAFGEEGLKETVDVVEKAGTLVGGLGKDIEKTAKNVGKDIKKTAKNVGKDIEKTGKSIIKGIASLF